MAWCKLRAYVPCKKLDMSQAMVAHAFNPSKVSRRKFKASLVYIEWQPATQRNSVLNIPHPHQKKKVGHGNMPLGLVVLKARWEIETIPQVRQLDLHTENKQGRKTKTYSCPLTSTCTHIYTNMHVQQGFLMWHCYIPWKLDKWLMRAECLLCKNCQVAINLRYRTYKSANLLQGSCSSVPSAAQVSFVF